MYTALKVRSDSTLMLSIAISAGLGVERENMPKFLATGCSGALLTMIYFY